MQGYNSYFVGESKVLVHNCEVKFNGNSKNSPKAQTVYGLKNKETKEIEKVGISGGKLDKNGKPYRANKQKGDKYDVEILIKLKQDLEQEEKHWI